MERPKKRRSVELKFSLLSMTFLLLCWIAVSLAAFYVGFIMGRSNEMEAARQRVPVLEQVGEPNDSGDLSFVDALPAAEKDLSESLPLLKDNKETAILPPQTRTSVTTPVTAANPAAASPGPLPTPGGQDETSDASRSTLTSAPPPQSPAAAAGSLASAAAAKPSPAAEQATKQDTGTGARRVLQVASFQKLQNAQELIRDLRKKGYVSYSKSSVDPKSHKPYYRVIVGPFAGQTEAEASRKQLARATGLRDILIRPVP